MDSSSNRLLDPEMVATKDWRKAFRSQPAYRIVNKTIRTQTQFITIVGLTGLCILFIFYMFPSKGGTSFLRSKTSDYNHTYPLTRPIRSSSLHMYRIGIIADLDTNSLSKNDKNTWYSYLKSGYLSYHPTKHTVSIMWDNKEPKKLQNQFALKGRGMELSELVVFNGKLLAFDDRTGIVFEIIDDKVVPWIILMDGDGTKSKGFKSEWATVKDETLYIGSVGKEWTTSSGDYMNDDPFYVKAVSTKGQISHINWAKEYKHLREALGIHFPGYMIHESGAWSDYHNKWFFLPRRCSTDKYNESSDEKRGCSVLISADSNINNAKVVKIPNGLPTRGFSSFKFIPTSNDYVIVALRTEEVEGKTATYITAFTIDGEVLLEDTFVSDLKFEGLEFI